MFRKRERFERSDVPRETPYTNVIGVVVLVVVFVALAMTVMAVWNRVKMCIRDSLQVLRLHRSGRRRRLPPLQRRDVPAR